MWGTSGPRLGWDQRPALCPAMRPTPAARGPWWEPLRGSGKQPQECGQADAHGLPLPTGPGILPAQVDALGPSPGLIGGTPQWPPPGLLPSPILLAAPWDHILSKLPACSLCLGPCSGGDPATAARESGDENTEAAVCVSELLRLFLLRVDAYVPVQYSLHFIALGLQLPTFKAL